MHKAISSALNKKNLGVYPKLLRVTQTNETSGKSRVINLTASLLSNISRFNGSSVERVEAWLKNGDVVYTEFSKYQIETKG